MVITSKDTQNILKLDYAQSISVKTSIGTLTDTAMVAIPKKVKWRGQSLEKYIKSGDTITISLGYKESGLEPVFSGFITSVSSVSPITLETIAICQIRLKAIFGQLCARGKSRDTKAADTKLIVKAKSLIDGKKKLEAQSPKGSTDGEIRTFYAPSCQTQKDLQDFADNMRTKYVNDKMGGSVTLFGIPFVKKGEKVKIKDEINLAAL